MTQSCSGLQAAGRSFPNKEMEGQKEGTNYPELRLERLGVGHARAGDPMAAPRARRKNPDFGPDSQRTQHVRTERLEFISIPPRFQLRKGPVWQRRDMNSRPLV